MNALFDLRAATLAARAGSLVIVRAVPRKGRAHDVTDVTAPVPLADAIAALRRFARTGAI